MFANLTKEEEESTALPAVLPGMEIFPQSRGIHVSDGEFQFRFGEICLEFKFQKKQIYAYMGNF